MYLYIHIAQPNGDYNNHTKSLFNFQGLSKRSM